MPAALVPTKSEEDLAAAMMAIDSMSLEELEAKFGGSSEAPSGVVARQKSDDEAFAEAMMALDQDNGVLFDAMQSALATLDLEIERHLLPPLDLHHSSERQQKQQKQRSLRKRLTGALKPTRQPSSLTALVHVTAAPASTRHEHPQKLAEKTKVQLVCEELIETEKRYGRALRLLQVHFASKLSGANASEWLPNLASLVDLSKTLEERMATAAEQHKDAALARGEPSAETQPNQKRLLKPSCANAPSCCYANVILVVWDADCTWSPLQKRSPKCVH